MDMKDISLLLRGFLYPAVIHEIRNILSNIKICCDYFTFTEKVEKREELVSEIDSQVDRGIQNILAYFDAIGGETDRQTKRIMHFPSETIILFKLLRTACSRMGVVLEIEEAGDFSAEISPSALLFELGAIILRCVLPAKKDDNNWPVELQIGHENGKSEIRLGWQRNCEIDFSVMETRQLRPFYPAEATGFNYTMRFGKSSIEVIFFLK